MDTIFQTNFVLKLYSIKIAMVSISIDQSLYIVNTLHYENETNLEGDQSAFTKHLPGSQAAL